MVVGKFGFSLRLCFVAVLGYCRCHLVSRCARKDGFCRFENGLSVNLGFLPSVERMGCAATVGFSRCARNDGMCLVGGNGAMRGVYASHRSILKKIANVISSEARNLPFRAKRETCHFERSEKPAISSEARNLPFRAKREKGNLTLNPPRLHQM